MSNIDILRQQIADLNAERAVLINEMLEINTVSETNVQAGQMPLADELALRERLDILGTKKARLESAAIRAKETYADSKAAYEALLQSDDAQEIKDRTRRQRRVQIVLSLVVPLIFLAIGVPLFMHGRSIVSLSFTALGCAFILFAILMAAGASVMLFRPDQLSEKMESRKQDLHWIMLQDKKKYESCVSERDQLQSEINIELTDAGLAEAKGSIRAAKLLLDRTHGARPDSPELVERRSDLTKRLAECDERLTAAHKALEDHYVQSIGQ